MGDDAATTMAVSTNGFYLLHFFHQFLPMKP
jgi:hypothetical protein